MKQEIGTVRRLGPCYATRATTRATTLPAMPPVQPLCLLEEWFQLPGVLFHAHAVKNWKCSSN